MNNRFFVAVLALGIAVLGVAASPSHAVRASLLANGSFGNGTPTYSWENTVNMTSNTWWTDAYLYQAKDGSEYGVCV